MEVLNGYLSVSKSQHLQQNIVDEDVLTLQVDKVIMTISAKYKPVKPVRPVHTDSYNSEHFELQDVTNYTSMYLCLNHVVSLTPHAKHKVEDIHFSFMCYHLHH